MQEVQNVQDVQDVQGAQDVQGVHKMQGMQDACGGVRVCVCVCSVVDVPWAPKAQRAEKQDGRIEMVRQPSGSSRLCRGN